MIKLENLIYPFDITTNEIWVAITDSVVPNVKPYYFVSNFGRVFTNTNNHIMQQTESNCNYLMVGLALYGPPPIKNTYVHRLVLSSFCPIPKWDSLEVNHKDGNKFNNCLYNLEWCTSKENVQHSFANNLHCKGEDLSYSKLTNDQVVQICIGLQNGIPFEDIAESIGPTDYKNILGGIRLIYLGYTWRHISCNYNFYDYEKNINYKFTEQEVHEICKRLEINMPRKQILTELGYDINSMTQTELARYIDVIKGITLGRVYKDISYEYTIPKRKYTHRL